MTYNWNTMVEITVPTGTNGWLYSGEVIINGVKVRFPVGVPTSVPEPAAALLKKMIELEQAEDANTAKPQNHYVGDVTIPAGKTLTLEEGAMVNDMAGGLGGGSASAGGGGFIVNATIGEIDPEVMSADCTFDKTFEETLAAIKAGQYVACHAMVEGMCIFRAVNYEETAICFSITMGQTEMQIIMFDRGGGSFIYQSGE